MTLLPHISTSSFDFSYTGIVQAKTFIQPGSAASHQHTDIKQLDAVVQSSHGYPLPGGVHPDAQLAKADSTVADPWRAATASRQDIPLYDESARRAEIIIAALSYSEAFQVGLGSKTKGAGTALVRVVADAEIDRRPLHMAHPRHRPAPTSLS